MNDEPDDLDDPVIEIEVEWTPDEPLRLDDGTPDIATRQGRFVHDRVFLRAPSGTDPLAAMRAAMAVFMETDDGPDAMVIGRVVDGRRAIEATATEETDDG